MAQVTEVTIEFVKRPESMTARVVLRSGISGENAPRKILCETSDIDVAMNCLIHTGWMAARGKS